MASDSVDGIIGITVPPPEYNPLPPETAPAAEDEAPAPPPEEAPLPDYEGNRVDESV